MLQEIHTRVRRGASFAFETTLSGLSYARLIPRWRRLGYRVKVIFLSLPGVEVAIARVTARVAQGGHGVAEEVIRRRFDRGLDNFNRVYKPIVDTWVWYDNSQPTPRLIDSGDNAWPVD